MQHRDMLPFSITQVIENEGNGKSTFFVSFSINAMDGIYRGSFNIIRVVVYKYQSFPAGGLSIPARVCISEYWYADFDKPVCRPTSIMSLLRPIIVEG